MWLCEMSLENCSSSPKQGQKHPKPGVDPKHNHNAGKDINMLVLGRKGVGKTGESRIPTYLMVNVLTLFPFKYGIVVWNRITILFF